MIFSWTQIGRFGFSDREIGSQIGRFFRGKKYSILVSKIVICSTMDHCKQASAVIGKQVLAFGKSEKLKFIYIGSFDLSDVTLILGPNIGRSQRYRVWSHVWGRLSSNYADAQVVIRLCGCAGCSEFLLCAHVNWPGIFLILLGTGRYLSLWEN